MPLIDLICELVVMIVEYQTKMQAMEKQLEEREKTLALISRLVKK